MYENVAAEVLVLDDLSLTGTILYSGLVVEAVQVLGALALLRPPPVFVAGQVEEVFNIDTGKED
jgi:hypothetical protein